MAEVLLENGTCLGIGGTNAREGWLSDGDLVKFDIEATPADPEKFAKWMGRRILDASQRGVKWVVAGFPGPVSQDGQMIGPMVNVNGFRDGEMNLVDAMTTADPALGRLLDEGFTLINVNDATLAAHAVAERVAEKEQNKVAALVIGTGVGAGVVKRDKSMPTIFRRDESCPEEYGHPFLSDDPTDTFENAISAPALKRRYNTDPVNLPANHSAWLRVGNKAGQLIMLLGLIQGANLVVPTGGVGGGAADKYGPHLDCFLKKVKNNKNNQTQIKHIPKVEYIPSSQIQEFEMYGAFGVMRDHLTRTGSATV